MSTIPHADQGDLALDPNDGSRNAAEKPATHEEQSAIEAFDEEGAGIAAKE